MFDIEGLSHDLHSCSSYFRKLHRDARILSIDLRSVPRPSLDFVVILLPCLFLPPVFVCYFLFFMVHCLSFQCLVRLCLMCKTLLGFYMYIFLQPFILTFIHLYIQQLTCHAEYTVRYNNTCNIEIKTKKQEQAHYDIKIRAFCLLSRYWESYLITFYPAVVNFPSYFITMYLPQKICLMCPQC